LENGLTSARRELSKQFMECDSSSQEHPLKGKYVAFLVFFSIVNFDTLQFLTVQGFCEANVAREKELSINV